MHLVTIAARNYLSRARALGDSFHTHNPGHRFSVLLVDALPGEYSSSNDCQLLTPADLPLDPDEFRRMALMYDVTELSTALKPWALQLLLDQETKTAVYLDPDILVYDSLAEVETLADQHGIVLTPHRETPMPRDGLRPTEAEIMCSGIFNLGFIAVSPAARPMLAWWQERLRRDCVSRPEQMLFVDQRWIDLVPGMWDHAILRDPGYNVAYWNLDDRSVERVGCGHTVNGRPLRFFHFSGFDPRRPWVLSKYVSDRPRVSVDDQPAVTDLCLGYADLILGMPRDAVDHPYRWNSLGDGTPVNTIMRRLYRDAVLAQDAGGSALPVPFTATDEAVLAWYRAPVGPTTTLGRMVHGLWSIRLDLQSTFPDPLGADSERLSRWAWRNVEQDPFLSPWLLPDVDPRPRQQPVDADTLGVNLAGYLQAEMGVGELSRLTADTLTHAAVPFATHVNRRTLSRQRADYDGGSTADVRYPVTIAAVNADQFPLWAASAPDLIAAQATVGLWAWETEDFPAYPESLALVDEIWAISAFVRDAVRGTTDKSVHVMPLPIPIPDPHEDLDRDRVSIPDGPYFLFAFDHLSVMERKNPLGLIAAYTRAFDEGEGPTLVIKTMNASMFRSDRARLTMAQRGRKDIVVIDDYLEKRIVNSLMGNATAYISLHRSEGFGLTMAESMARGVPVIATDYSGNRDFMTEKNSLLVPHRMVPVGPEAAPYDPRSWWAEPDLDVAAQHIRWVVDNPQAGALLGDIGRQSIRATHGLASAAAFVTERLSHLYRPSSVHRTHLIGDTV